MLELKIEPVTDMILVQRHRKKSKLELPNHMKYSGHLEVMAVGPGGITDNGARVEPEVKVGDWIIAKHGTFFHSPPGLQSDEDAIRGDEPDWALLRWVDVAAVVSGAGVGS